MALDIRETGQLVAVLQMEQKPFQTILESLKGFARQESGGRTCLALRCMIHDDYYQSFGTDVNSELLITAFILHSISIGQNKENNSKPPPNTKSVLYLLLQYIENEIRENEFKRDEIAYREKIAIKVFILQCLADCKISEVLSRSPRQVLEEDLHSLIAKHSQLQSEPHLLEQLQIAQDAYLEETNSASTGFISKGVTPLVIPPDTFGMDTGPGDKWRVPSKEAHQLDLRFDPICDRPPPPPLGLQEQELCWLYTEGHATDLVWDTTMSNTPDEALELRDRIQKALRQSLANEEQNSLKLKLSQNPDALLRVGVSPTRFPTLVERNSNVASHFITMLLQSNVPTAEEFLTALVNMNPCLGACNVMSDLVKIAVFPVKYAHDFIVNSITFVKSKSSADTRRIGVICTFCLQLVREGHKDTPKGRILQSKELVAQLTQFAVEHSGVLEAASLYKALRERSDAPAE
eukprot:TRINITY_DN3194_c0_g1_i1.p1 TRINITY_DN3194_c0_g1~~TRINITY_DN3194_c0_g1_i1.p1  ORF type:complete len:463 (+),score=173.20 TRINITY_DN3194_c0_g1_i1:199-1587(+)